MLTRWKPLERSLAHGLWDDFFLPTSSAKQRSDSFSPAVDISEEENRYLLTADLPGISEKDIELKVEDGVLTAVHLDMPELIRPIGIIHRRQKLLTPTTVALMDFLRQYRPGDRAVGSSP